MNRDGVNVVAMVAAVSFSLHLVWENAQAPFYIGYLNFWQHFFLCLGATVGDVAVTLLVYAGTVAVTRNPQWPRRLSRPAGLALAMVGAVIAVGMERRALAVGRWAYTAAMPIIPGLGVGVTPVLQMVVLLPLTFWLVRIILDTVKKV